MKNEKFNLVRAKQISDKLTDIERHPFKIQSAIEPDPGLEPHKEPAPDKWLYYFVNQFTYIENIHLNSKIEIKTDSEASALVRKYPTDKEMKVTAVYLKDAEQTIPGPLKNYPDLRILTVVDASQLSNLVYSQTLVRISPEKLSNADLINFKKLPLSKKIDVFMNKVNQDKMKTETRDRILKCLQIADEKQKKECLKNCKK